MKDIGPKIIAGILVGSGSILLIILLFLYGIFAMGFVGMKLWAWFVVPTFALPAITWAQSFGISLLVKLWTFSHSPTSKEDKVNYGGLILFPWITLLIGWIVKAFIL